MSEQPAANTDRELYREIRGDYYAPSVHVTTDGCIGMNVGGTLFTAPIGDWHAAMKRTLEPPRAAPEPRSTPGPSTGTPEPSQAASEAQADAWDKGYASGFSNAMRRMSDEPQAPTTSNPFRAALASVDAPAPDEADEPECACYVTPESTWLSAASCGYGSGYEPGSQMEWNPDCPLHPGAPAAPAVPAEGDESR